MWLSLDIPSVPSCWVGLGNTRGCGCVCVHMCGCGCVRVCTLWVSGSSCLPEELNTGSPAHQTSAELVGGPGQPSLASCPHLALPCTHIPSPGTL